MKHIYLTLGLLLTFQFTFGQTNTFPASGNVGIGTTSPNIGLLQINGTGDLLWMSSTNFSSPLQFNAYNTLDFKIIQRSAGLMTFWTNTIERMRLDQNGNFAIGTTDSKGYKLAVAGNMITESIKVKLQTAWPDYVFAKSYSLPSLQTTEQFIKDKGHLPGIPSSAEVKANGIDLGEMNAKLLQKIEELTLHLIEMKKENDKQNKQNEQLLRRVNQLELMNRNKTK